MFHLNMPFIMVRVRIRFPRLKHLCWIPWSDFVIVLSHPTLMYNIILRNIYVQHQKLYFLWHWLEKKTLFPLTLNLFSQELSFLVQNSRLMCVLCVCLFVTDKVLARDSDSLNNRPSPFCKLKHLKLTAPSCSTLNLPLNVITYLTKGTACDKLVVEFP